MSRVHAVLKFVNGKFLIFDNESKFGTLILLKDNYKIKEDKAAIQIGRTVFTFVLKYQRPSYHVNREPAAQRVQDANDQHANKYDRGNRDGRKASKY